MTRKCEGGTSDGQHFRGAHALVTGATGGIGSETVLALLRKGAAVSALDLDPLRLDALVSIWEREGGDPSRLAVCAADVRDSHSIARAVEHAHSNFGAIDLLANVAGIVHTGGFMDTSEDDWNAVFAVNLMGAANVCRAVAPSMIERRRGAIVNVGSNSGSSPRLGMSVYSSSKAALAQMTRCLALELAEHGIRCNLVSPGATDSCMLDSMTGVGTSREDLLKGSLDSYRHRTPLQKIAIPADVANAILFLLSDQASHITMHDLRVDGGATLGC